MDYLKRTWAEIDLGAIESNYRAIRALLKPKTKVCCVVKADAYGHGAEMLAKVYESLGADWFAVSNLEEALQLRRAGAEKAIHRRAAQGCLQKITWRRLLSARNLPQSFPAKLQTPELLCGPIFKLTQV